jgi:clan AA aspartic protease (TIGR02281 family)
MLAIDIGKLGRDALAQCGHPGRHAGGGPAGIGPLVLAAVTRVVLAASVVFAMSTALAAGVREDCAVATDNSDQKIASCARVIADDTQTAADRAAAYSNRGLALLSKNDFDHAIADFDQAISLDSGSFEFHKNRGNAYGAKNDFDHAIADFDEAIRLNPSFAIAYNNRGFVYLRKGDIDRAIADYSEAINHNPNFALAYSNRGFAYSRKGDFDRAIADSNEAIGRNPNIAGAYDNRGFAYANKGDLDRALSDYNEAIRRDPRLANALAHRGVLYVVKGDYSRAIADLNGAIARDVNFAYAYDNRCSAYYGKRDYDAAIADCSAAIKLNPRDDFALATRSLARAAKRDFDAAIADGSEAIKVNPKSGAGYNSRGGVYRLKKDYDAAIADFSAAIELNPRMAAAYGNRGMTYREKGDLDHALADLDRALEVNPRYFQGYNFRGLTYVAKGDQAHAIADYSEAIKVDPLYVEAYNNRGLAYKALGRTADAVNDFRRAQSIDPSDQVSKAQLALLVPGGLQTMDGAVIAAISAAMKRLAVDLPMTVAGVDPVKGPLEELGREPCDREAITALGQALERIGRKRDAASAYASFSGACGGHAPSLRAAANILLALSDYTGATAIASDLIKLEPREDGNYYLRAVAYDRAGMAKKAIDDYATAIELFGNKVNIGSDSYLAIARNHEKLGQYCDAALSIESWVALNPERNDSSRMQAIIADDTAKGNCNAVNSRSEEEFRIPAQKNVVRLPVTVNGVRGTFIMDTGATFVTMHAAFAQRANVQIDQDSSIQMHSANGVVEGKRGRAASIQLRSLQAKDVVVVVQPGGQTTYGQGIDGLLGMSFLSRFKVSIDTESVKISGRNAK